MRIKKPLCLLAGVMAAIALSIGAKASGDPRPDTTIERSCELTTADSGGVRTLTAELPADIPELTDLRYTWYRNGVKVDETTVNYYRFNVADNGGATYYCVVTGHQNNFFSLIDEVYKCVLQRNADTTGMTNRWQEITDAQSYLDGASWWGGTSFTGWQSCLTRANYLLYCNGSNNACKTVEKAAEVTVSSKGGIGYVLKTEGQYRKWTNEAVALFGGVFFSEEYATIYADQDVDESLKSLEWDGEAYSTAVTVSKQSDGTMDHVINCFPESDWADIGYFKKEGREYTEDGTFYWTGRVVGNYPDEYVNNGTFSGSNQFRSPRQMIYDAYLFFMGREPADSDIEYWMNKYKEARNATGSASTAKGLGKAQSHTGSNGHRWWRTVYADAGILVVLNGIGNSGEALNYLSDTYHFKASTGKFEYEYDGNDYADTGQNNYVITSNTVEVEPTYATLDLNGMLDGTASGSLGGYGTADVYINGVLWADDAEDFYRTDIPYNADYEIRDIKASEGRKYSGIASGSLTGKAVGTKTVVLKFDTQSYKITLKKGTGISSVSGGGTYLYGTSVTVSASVKTGYTWQKWTGTLTSSDRTYTFTVPAQNVTLTANAVDQTSPSGSISQNPTGWTNGNVVLTVTASDEGSGLPSAPYSWNGGGWTSERTCTVTTNGTYSVKIRDNAGNVCTLSKTVTNIDKINPTGSLTQSPSGWTSGNVTLTLVGAKDRDATSEYGKSGLQTNYVKWDSSWGTQTQKTVTVNGTYTATLRDNAGNTETETVTVSNIDRTKPDIIPSATPDKSKGDGVFYIDSTPTLEFQVSDSQSGVNTASGKTYASLTNTSGRSKTYTVSGGKIVVDLRASGLCGEDCTLIVRAEDNVGNTRKYTYYIRDNVSPNVTLTPSYYNYWTGKWQTQATWTNRDVKLTVTASDTGFGLARYPYRWKKGARADWGIWSVATTCIVSANDTYSVAARDNEQDGSFGPNTRTVSHTVSTIDRVAPVISGLEEFSEIVAQIMDNGGRDDIDPDRLIDRDKGTDANGNPIKIELRVTDDLSGVHDVKVVVVNYDNGQTGTYTAGADGKITINVMDDIELFYGDFHVSVTAYDNAGNSSVDQYDTTGFYLNAEIERMLGDPDDTYQAGESGILTISAGGYVDRLAADLPDDIAWDTVLADGAADESLVNSPYTKTFGAGSDQKTSHTVQFMVPLYTEEGTYTIEVSAVKEIRDDSASGGTREIVLQTITLDFYVSGTLLDDIRTTVK